MALTRATRQVGVDHILHDWNLETKKHLIRSAYEALPPGGALVVYESIIDDDRSKNAFGLLMSLNMLIETGRVRLQRRGLLGVDERSGIPRDPRRAAGRARVVRHGNQVTKGLLPRP